MRGSMRVPERVENGKIQERVREDKCIYIPYSPPLPTYRSVGRVVPGRMRALLVRLERRELHRCNYTYTHTYTPPPERSGESVTDVTNKPLEL